MGWIRIRKDEGRWIDQISNGASVPQATASHDFASADASAIATIESLRDQARAAGLDSTFVIHDDNDSTLKIDTSKDTRPRVRVELLDPGTSNPKTEIDADGSDAIEIKLTILKPDLTPNTTFTSVERFKVPRWFLGDEPRWVKVSFANGIATKNFKTTNQGSYAIRSNRIFRVFDAAGDEIIDGSLSIEAYE